MKDKKLNLRDLHSSHILGVAGILVLVQKDSHIPKKKGIVSRILKKMDQVYHSKQTKSKRKIKFFNSTLLCFPELYIYNNLVRS